MPELLAALLSFAAAWLLGSIPGAQLSARLAGRDIFRTGSGNMGTMNALRNLGPLFGVLTFVIDVVKGSAAALLAPLLAGLVAPDSPAAVSWALAAAAPAAGAGHMFSVFTGFRGGKALAVAFGFLLPHFWPVALAGLVLIALLVALTRNVNLASILAISAAAVTVLVLEVQGGEPGGLIRGVGVLLLAGLIVWKHLPVTASARNPLVSDR